MTDLPTNVSNVHSDIGIGNKSILANLGINSLIDLPGVGENLQVNSIDLQAVSFLIARQDHSLLVQVYEVLNTTFTYGTLTSHNQRIEPHWGFTVDILRNNETYNAEQEAL